MGDIGKTEGHSRVGKWVAVVVLAVGLALVTGVGLICGLVVVVVYTMAEAPVGIEGYVVPGDSPESSFLEENEFPPKPANGLGGVTVELWNGEYKICDDTTRLDGRFRVGYTGKYGRHALIVRAHGYKPLRVSVDLKFRKGQEHRSGEHYGIIALAVDERGVPASTPARPAN